MEYYDSLNKTEFYEFYFTKSKKLYYHPKVIELLDGDSFSEVQNMSLYHSNNIYESPVKRQINFDDDMDYSDKRIKMRTKTVSNFKVILIYIEKKPYG
jgi:hypothetical protein